jgi:hypothetical protein
MNSNFCFLFIRKAVISIFGCNKSNARQAAEGVTSKHKIEEENVLNHNYQLLFISPALTFIIFSRNNNIIIIARQYPSTYELLFQRHQPDDGLSQEMNLHQVMTLKSFSISTHQA